MSEPAPRVRVVLIDEELVAERGNKRIVWLVAQNDGFVAAALSAGARSERFDAGPGVVWRSRIELELERGSTVIRVETRPSAARGSTLAHLTGSAKQKRPRLVRTRFVVGPRGELIPENHKTRTTK